MATIPTGTLSVLVGSAKYPGSERTLGANQGRPVLTGKHHTELIVHVNLRKDE